PSSVSTLHTRFSDIKLFTIPIKSKYQKLDMNSRMAQMAILDCIFVKVVLNKFGRKESVKDAE
ncbi:MAG: hypothetical protein M1308_20960, partial [Actinobacteria bacterium]|nr:hypothetical protein [Actinomycetota bacterium]